MPTLAARGHRRSLPLLVASWAALWALLLAGTLGLGCGEEGTGVVLTIDSTRSVPDEVDRLVIRLSAEGFPDKTQARALERSFPHSLGIDVDSSAGVLSIAVWGMLGETEVTSSQIEVQTVPGEVIGAEIVLR